MKQFVFPEPNQVDFDKIGHTGKFFGTTAAYQNKEAK